MATVREQHAFTELLKLRQFARVSRPRFQEHDDGGLFTRLPGFRFTDFNSTGFVTVVSIDRVLQCIPVRWSVRNPAVFDEVLLYNIGHQLNISERLYDRAAVDFPMTLRWLVTGVGKSSFDRCMVLSEDNGTDTPTSSDDTGLLSLTTDQPLATCVERIVIVDPLTRRKTPMSVQLNNDLSASLVTNSERFPTIRLPAARTCNEVRFTYNAKVCGDDLHFQRHSNVSSYVKYVMECARAAIKSGFYSSIRDNLDVQRLKSMTSLHVAESYVDDELDVTTWENSGLSKRLNFVVRRQETMIYSSQMEFYEQSSIRSPL